MSSYYSNERNIQMLIYLMKEHGIRKVIASPGSTNITFVASIQQDPYFEIYSSVDERSAAYMACGLSAESGEPVALSCTGATASRNYVPGLTEAYYRKLPVLAITSTQHMGLIGQYVPQVIDRTQLPNDIAKLSVQIPIIHDDVDEWSVNVALNNALLELCHHGGGPVHINMTTSYPFYSANFLTRKLPVSRSIFRIVNEDELPSLENKQIAIFVGNHIVWSSQLTDAVDYFCERYNAVVWCDYTSNYTGKYGVSASLVTSQDLYKPDCISPDVVIHIGEVSGAYLAFNAGQVWRVNPDGEIRDTFKKLKYVFEMKEITFFQKYSEWKKDTQPKTTYCDEWRREYQNLVKKIPELPFSNIWIAQQTACRLPANSYLYLGILNSLRAWNFCEIRKDIVGFSNTGGFGIDGGLSSMVGGALAHPDALHFEVLGDLAFFYDFNSIGNRHVANNIRILLVNNGLGTEFKNYSHFASEFKQNANMYIAAAGHYGNKSSQLVKHYAQDLGFEYLFAGNKTEYLECMEHFVSAEMFDKPILFEVFTNEQDESDALKLMRTLEISKEEHAKQTAKKMVKGLVGDSGVAAIKKLIK